jgi:hypothetical protein
MTLSVHEFSVQDAELLPAREALQAGTWGQLGGLFSGLFGAGTGMNQVPGHHGGDLYGNHPGNYMNSGPRPLPAIL